MAGFDVSFGDCAMRNSYKFRFYLLVCLAASPCQLLAGEAAQAIHKWASVNYPELPRQDQSLAHRSISLVNNTNTLTHENTLDLYLSYGVESSERPANAGKVVIRLHCPGGAIFDAKSDSRANGVGVGNAKWVTYSYIYNLPWRTNVMEEAWLELHFPGQVYWAEIPYGFTRNPSDPLPVSGATSGKPFFAPAMKKMGDKDKIVPWSRVNYRLGRIQNNWDLELNLSNPGDARAELILYRDDSEVGKSMYLWDLHSPQTKFAIQCSRTLGSTGMSVRLHEDGMRRSDSFNVSREPNEGRGWGSAIITVDNKTYDCLIPSSLFQFQHGMADPQSKAMIPVSGNRY